LASIIPSTRSTAREAGWPIGDSASDRIGNGHVFGSEFMSEDEAHSHIDAESRRCSVGRCPLIKFRTGRSRQVWNKNVIAVGCPRGFLEPLEATTIISSWGRSTSILTYFPSRDFEPHGRGNSTRNRSSVEFETIKDFLILHYYASPGASGPSGTTSTTCSYLITWCT